MKPLTLMISLFVCACGSTPAPAPAPVRLAAYDGDVRLVRGTTIQTQTAGLWSTLPTDAIARRPEALKTDEAGAVLELAQNGTTIGRLWVQAGTQLRLGRNPAGHLSAVLSSGAARLQTYDDVRRDVLLAPKRSPLPTAAAPRNGDWATDLMSDPAPAGVGTLTPGQASAQLDLHKLHVRATTNGDVVDVEVEHRFYSHADEAIEGTFRFPLPADAILTGLAMEIDGQLMEGSLVEREKARKIYDDIVDQMQDPAILEWEAGNVFKLRVFPIESRIEKRVVLRYSVPVLETLSGPVFRYDTAAPAMKSTIGHFTVELDGVQLKDVRDFDPAGSTVGDVATQNPVHAVVRDGQRYTTVRITPEWPTAPNEMRQRTLVLFVDTSRSTLETAGLARQAAKIALASLAPDDRFALLSGDIIVRHHTDGAIQATPAHRAAALASLAAVDHDGASDLSAALWALTTAIANTDGPTEVLYVGDGVATWGEADPAARLTMVAKWSAPFHAVSLERDAETAHLRALAGESGGVVATPRALVEVRRFVDRLATSTAADRLVNVVVTAPAGFTVYPNAPQTLFRGDPLVVSVRGPADASLQSVSVRGSYGGTAMNLSVPVTAPATGGRADQRWAAAHIAALTAEKADQAEIVKLSEAFGVMSKYTAFLVLENEEAYAQHQITRKAARKQGGPGSPRIAGADLESDGERQANLSHDHIQPGDPEVRVPAPADAKAVWVFFPFGEVHQATWEPELDLWTTRFLISKETPDGEYFIRVRVTHADDRVELITLRYVVDTLKPAVEVRLTNKGGRYLIEARQLIREGELTREGYTTTDPTFDLTSAREKYAHLVADLRRVDVRLPDGQVIALSARRLGQFRGHWKPRAAVGEMVGLTVVAHDRALNANPQLFTLDPTDQSWQLADGGDE